MQMRLRYSLKTLSYNSVWKPYTHWREIRKAYENTWFTGFKSYEGRPNRLTDAHLLATSDI